MEVSPVGLCNHRCVFCAYDYINYPNRKLDKERFLSFLDEALGLGIKSILYAGEGEPLLHPHIGEFVQRTNELGIDAGMFSNGEMLSEKKARGVLPYLKFLRFSFNGGNAETYAKIHKPNAGGGGATCIRDRSKVIQNIAYAAKLRKEENLELDLGSQFVLLEENKDSLLEGVQTLRECGVDFISIKPFVFQNEQQKYRSKQDLDSEEIASLVARAKVYETDNFKVIFRENAFENTHQERQYKHCRGCSFITTLNSAGDMATCLPYWDKQEFVYGNIYKQNFYEIWNGEKRAKIKTFLETKLDVGTCPKNCRPNAINEFLEDILEAKVKHINFI
ncbi:radical SAM protein [Helicobacter cinaedi]|nr:radical SAM protein [Helicobacter cinaedi]